MRPSVQGKGTPRLTHTRRRRGVGEAGYRGAVGVPDLDAWRAWEPAEAHAVLAGVGLVDSPWYVAGGWAVDLYLGLPVRTMISR
jgi:hypothetical protein